MNSTSRQGSWSSLSLSVLLHLLLAGAIFGAWWWSRQHQPEQPRLGIEATVVNPGSVMAPAAAPAPEPEPLPPPEPAAEVPPEPPPPDDTAEQERQKAEAQAEAARVAEERRLAEEREAAERQAQEKAARDKAEREKAEKAAKEKAEKEKAEKERLAREKAERDKQELERKQKAEAERARAAREAELNAQLAAEERVAAARASGQMAQYQAMITRAIESKWIRPASARPGLECEVRVTQVSGGAVTAVQIGRCNGDESVKQSIEAAVYRASPLPQPPDPALFERNLVVTFRPER